MTNPRPAARSLAEIFPPQHVQQWKPTLALYFPIGATCMAHSARCLIISLSGACLSFCWEDLTPQLPLYCKHSSFSTPCGCNDLPKALLPLSRLKNAAVPLCSHSCANVFALHAGCVVAAFRMALWAALILLDSQWLTDHDVTINGESLDSRSAPCQQMQGSQWCVSGELGLSVVLLQHLPFKRMPYACMQSCCSFWASMCGGTTRS